jgi:threonine/homoserine/homoserine lactone efflux protein
MIVHLLPSPRLSAFIIASFVLAVTPGPAVLYLITQTLGKGRRAGLASVAGIALGNLGNATFACVGLAALFTVSKAAFVSVKVAGAAYLIFLGIKALKSKPIAEVAQCADPVSAVRLFRDGFLVALLNPKTALFFAALLPQFLSSSAPPLAQSLVLSCVFVSIAICTDTIYILTASALAIRIPRRSGLRRHSRYISAVTFIGLGVYAAFAKPHPIK